MQGGRRKAYRGIRLSRPTQQMAAETQPEGPARERDRVRRSARPYSPIRSSRFSCSVAPSGRRRPLGVVESRRGAVTWAVRQRPVSSPRSSNRTCRFPASGFPTDFIVKHTAAAQYARVEGAARPSLRRHAPGRSVAYRVPAPCADGRGSDVHGHRHDCRWLGMPAVACRS